jgi:serine/threonine protein kinase/WD40 repeat protein
MKKRNNCIPLVRREEEKRRLSKGDSSPHEDRAISETADRTESIFAAAVALATVGERAAYLDQACAGDTALRGHVEALLRAHERAGHLLDRPAQGIPAGTEAYIPNQQPGTVIAGRYKLLEAIGEGGMGTVWVAEQTQPVRRKVALKLIKAGMDSKNVLARFEAERQALAVMDHPNIAKVLDGGLTETGRPFFVMEYVKGVPITEYCDATRLSVPERLNLFVQVCHAVQHAHQKGIIHRDLKPSNILVAPYDDKPVPKVIDFGLAKAMHQSLTERTLHTAHETVLGTPLYMSPEQAQLNNLDVDTRSDIYSLGVLLYELVTGTTPLEKQRFKEAAWDEIRRIIREEEPPRPSSRLSSSQTLPSLAAGRQTEPTKLTRLVRGELDWIVMKALEKDRTRRYETASAFAADLRRHLAEEPVEAGPPRATYRLRKFIKRNRAMVTASAVVLLTLVAGTIGTTWGLFEALDQREQAEQARKDEAKQRQSAYDAIAARAKAEEKARLAAEVQEKAAGRSAKLLATELAFEKGTQRLQNGTTGPGLLWLARALETVPADADDLQHSLRLLLGGWTRPLQPLQAVVPHQFEGFSGQPIVIMPGGKTVVNLIYDGNPPGHFVLRFWDMATGNDPTDKVLPWIFLPDPAGEMQETLPNPLVHVSENGKWILASMKKDDALLTQPDGRVLWTRQDETVWLYDTATKERVGKPLKHTKFIRAMTCSSDGKKVRTITTDLLIHEWDVETGKLVGKTQLKAAPDADLVTLDAATFSDDGKMLVTASTVTTVVKTPPTPSPDTVVHWETVLWDARTGKRVGKPLTRLKGNQHDRHNLVALSPDAKTVLTQYSDGIAVLWNIANADNPRLLNQLSDNLAFAAFSPDSKTVLAINAEGVHLYETTHGQHVGLCLAASRMAVAAFSPDGQSIRGVSTDLVVHTWQFKPLAPVRVTPENCSVITNTPNGKTILYDHTNQAVRIWEAQTGTLFGKPCPLAPTLAFAKKFADWTRPSMFMLSPDGNTLVVALNNWSPNKGVPDNVDIREIQVWDVETGKLLRKHAPEEGTVEAKSRDGKKFGLFKWTDNQWKVVVMKPAALGAFEKSLSSPDIRDWSFSPDNNQLLIIGNQARVWDVETRKPVGEALRIGEYPVVGGFFCPNGKRIVTTHVPAKSTVNDFFQRPFTENLVQIWDARTGKPVSNVWREPVREASVPNHHRASCLPDSESLLITGPDQQAQVWRMPAPLKGNPEQIRLWIETLTGMELDSGGALVDLDAQTWNERYDRLQKLGGPQ